jgi:hypothetical protein
MAEELLSIEMRLSVDRAMRDYSEFKAKLQRAPIDVKFDLGLNKTLAEIRDRFKDTKIHTRLDLDLNTVLRNAQKHFDNHKLKLKLDTSAAENTIKAFTRDHGTVNARVNLTIDDAEFKVFERQLQSLSDRSLKLGTTADMAGLTAFKAALTDLTDKTLNITGGAGIAGLKADIAGLVADLSGLQDRVVQIRVERAADNNLDRVLQDLQALQAAKIKLSVDDTGDSSITSVIRQVQALQADNLKLNIGIEGAELTAFIATIDAIRATALSLDVRVAGGEFQDLVATLDKLRTEVVQVRVTADNSDPTLRIVHEQIEDFKAAAHNGVHIPITADAKTFGTTAAMLKSLEVLSIQTEVDKGKLAAAVALIQSKLNPEDFVAKLTIDTSDLEGSMTRLREAQRDLTALKKGVAEAFALQDTQDVLTQQIRNVKTLQEANEDRIRREAALQRLAGAKTMKDLQAWAKELSITPTTGLKKADYEAMFRSLLEIEDAAELVAAAWKITGKKFDSVTDEMEAKSEHTKNVLWGNLNHGAADLVRFAWDRTSASFKGDLNDMEQAAERAGKQISDALSAAAKDSTFKLTVDSKQAKKDLGDFQNYARLLAKNDLDFNINKLKANTNYDGLETQLKSLQRLKREAAKDDKGNIQVEIDGINAQISAYKRLEKAARDEYRARIDALDTQSKAYKILIASQEQLERSTKEANAAQSTFDKEQVQARMDRINGYLAERKQRVQTSNANRAAYIDEINFNQQLIELNQQIAAGRKKRAEDAAALDKKTSTDVWVGALQDKQRMDKLNADIRAGKKLALDRQLADLQKSVDAEFAIKRRASLAEQKRFIQDTMALKDTKVDSSGAGGLGMAGIGADLSKLEKLQEKLEAVQRTKRELIQGGIDLKINDNLDQFRTALNKLAKEEITITAKIKEEYEGGKPGGKLGGALKSIGGEFLQAFNIDLQSVVQGAIQGYQAIAGGIFSVAKASLAEFGAIQASAQKTATLLMARDTTTEGATARGEAQIKLYDRMFAAVQKTSIASGNLFGGKEIGSAADTFVRAGASVEYVENNLTRIATAATAAKEDLEKVGSTSLMVASKFTDASDTALDKYRKQSDAVKIVAFGLTNAKLKADNLQKSFQYLNPTARTREAMMSSAADIVAYARLGVVGSKTGTSLNTLYKDLTKTLDGTTKKALSNADAFDAVDKVIGGIDYDKFKDSEGNIKDSTESMQELVRVYAEYEKQVGTSKAGAMFQEIFGVQGMNALKNGVVALGKERVDILAQMKKAALDEKDGTNAYMTAFAESMKAGWQGGLKRFENIRDTYYSEIGKVLAPIGGGIMNVMNNVLERSFSMGGGSALGDQIKRVSDAFKAFGSNQVVVNGLAQAFNRVAIAVSGKLLGVIESLVGYLSDDQKVMDLANGIGFWITATIDAFTTATKLILDIGVAAANVGNILTGVRFAPLAKTDAEALTKGLEEVNKLKEQAQSLAGLKKLAKESEVDLEKRLAEGTNLTAKEQEMLNAKLADARKTYKDSNDALTITQSKLRDQEKLVAEINAKQSIGAKVKGKDMGAMEGALSRFGGAMKLISQLEIGESFKKFWDKILSPSLAAVVDLFSVAVLGAAVALKAVLVVTEVLTMASEGLVALVDKKNWAEFGYFIKQTGTDAEEAAKPMRDWIDSIGLSDEKIAQWPDKVGAAATSAGKWMQDKATETTTWFAQQEEARTLRNAEEGAKREAYWNEQGARIQQSISTVTTWFSDRWREAGDTWNTWMAQLGASWNTIMTALGSIWNSTIANIGAAWNRFVAGLGPAFEQARAAVAAKLAEIAQTIGNLASRIPGVFQAAWNAAASSVGTIGTAIQNVFGNAFNVVQNAVGGLVQNFQNAWSGAIDAIGGQIGGLIDKARSIPVVGGLIPGFASGGVIMGPASKTDNVMIMARGGEGVLVPEAVSALGGAAGLERLNRRAEAGALGFAAGGVISPIKGTGGKGSVSVVSANPPAVNSAIVTTAKTAEKSATLAKTVALDQATYWAKSLTLLNNLYAGMKSISDKISQLKVTFAQPVAAYSSGSGLLGAPSLSAAPASNPLTVFNNSVLASRGGAAGSKTEIRVARTGKKDSEGLEILRMDLVELGTGRIVDSVLGNSGVRSTQTYTSGNAVGARPGSLAPIPTGRFGLAPTTTSSDPGVQGWFVPITGAGDNKQGRGDFGIHMDANRAMSPGSAGCIVLYDPAAKSRVQAWLNNANAPKELTVSYGNATAIDGSAIAAATNSSVSRGTGGLSQATVNRWMQGGTNSLMAKAIGMAEGNRTASGGYTKYASGHTDPGNGAYNIGSFSAQGGLNDGTIAGSDQRVLDRLIKPRVGELFAAAAKAGVIVTPQILFNYLDLANQAPTAATGDRNGKGFLGGLASLKGKENDQAAIAALRVEGFRNNSGRLETTFTSQAALLKDQQRRMAELTDAIAAFQIKGDVVTGAATTQQNLTQAQVNFKALTEKLNPADQALVASVDAGDTAQAAAELKKRLDELSAQRDALVKSAPKPADPKKATEAEVKANKALKEKVAALDKRKTELQSVINATYKIDTAETQISNRKAEAAYNDEMAALNEYARLVGGAKEDAKESAKLRDLMRARDESQAEVAIAQKNKARDLEILEVENANAIKREQSRKGGDVEALRKLQALQKTDKIAALDEAIREAQYAVATQNNKLEDFYRVNGLDDRADALAEVIALQKRVREKSIDQQELDAALKRLGIANINGQFVVDKALTAQLSDISGKVEKAADRSQGQIEKLMRGQGLVLKDALFEALDLEYNYYMQKRDSDLNKASAEQLSFLYGKNLLRTGSFEGGSYIQGAQGNLRDRVGEISLAGEDAIRTKKLEAISALARITGGLTEAQAKAMAEAAGGKIEVVRAGVNPGLKQATGKRLTALSDVPYTPRSEIQAAIRESQSAVAAPLVAASAPSAGYMAKATAPMRIKLDIPPGTDERITSVVRQTEAALNSDEYTQRMMGELMSILRSDPQLARQISF